MTYPSDDLASVLLAPDREHTGYGQAIIRAWNPNTFENTIEYRGTELHNLPVLAGVEALTYQPGDVVLLMKWTPTGRGLASYWVAGRPVVPAAGRAEELIAFMQTTLAEAIAKQILAATMLTDSVFGIGTRNDTDYGALSGIDAGPEITVDVSSVGKAVVALSCQTTASISAGRQGLMSVDVTGATTWPADDNAYIVGLGGDDTLSVTATGAGSRFRVFDFLNEGEHTFTALYRTITEDGDVQFVNPNMVVWAF